MQEINAKYNLKSLLENYRVVIPLIQRDYAQGRKDKRTTEVRKKLLQDINTALIDTNIGPLDLNFIYGKSTNGLKPMAEIVFNVILIDLMGYLLYLN